MDPRLDQAHESAVVCIGVGSSLALALVGSALITLLIGCRRPASSTTSLMESEPDGFTEDQFSLTVADPFLSEENAMSVGGWAE
jgi:hypothetical protein